MRAVFVVLAVSATFFAVLLGGGELLGLWDAEPAASSARAGGPAGTIGQQARVAKKRVTARGTARKQARKKAVDRQRPRLRFNAADQAAARAAVLRAGDFAPGSGWSGGREEVEFSASPCPDFRPQQSDLVVTGAAASGYKGAGGLLTFSSDVHVLRTREMVERDWLRTVANRGLVRCLRTGFVKAAKREKLRFVSLKRLRFPQLGRYSTAYRVLLDVPASRRQVRMISDIVLVGGNRTELTFMATAPYASRRALAAAEKRLLRRLARRMQA